MGNSPGVFPTVEVVGACVARPGIDPNPSRLRTAQAATDAVFEKDATPATYPVTDTDESPPPPVAGNGTSKLDTTATLLPPPAESLLEGKGPAELIAASDLLMEANSRKP